MDHDNYSRAGGRVNTTRDIVLGAVLGVILTIILEDPLKERWAKWRRRRFARQFRRAIGESDGTVPIAGYQTSVYLVDGDGASVLERGNVHLQLRPGAPKLPEAVVARANQRREEIESRAAGDPEKILQWNSPNMASLIDYQMSRSPTGERPVLSGDLHASDYATFSATVLGLDEKFEKATPVGVVGTTLRTEYLSTPQMRLQAARKPIPELAHGVGVMLLAFTDDKDVVLVRRRSESRARPGERDVSVVEGIDIAEDRGAQATIDVYKTAKRGCWEELGVEVSNTDIKLLGLAVDMDYYQWNFLGLVNTRMSSTEILEMYALHAKDRWEGKLEFVPLDPIAIFRRLRDDKIWSIGLICTYLALCYQTHDPKLIQRSATRVFGERRSRGLPWR